MPTGTPPLAERHALLGGRYALLERLACGGASEVWRARDAALGRDVAVKLSRPAMGEPASASACGGGAALADEPQALRREALLLSRLRSPHAVLVLDVGSTAAGAPFVVLELLSGCDLYSLVTRQGPLPPPRACHLLAQACDALGEVHRLGLVHGDVTPGNMIATRAGGLDVDFLKLVDFGLAVDGEGKQDEWVRGTPAFMAPEVVLGERAGPRSDVYGLGAVLFWLLTGGLLFEGDVDPLDVLAAQVERSPPPLPAGLSPGLADLVSASLAKAPSARPADASEFLLLLERAGVPPWPRELAARCWAAHGECAPRPAC
ncbi:MAG: serine/threonine protein kinase [Planctomycetes bacterium]|nr:serine/threonine protein kinase [Planctomycetota bacterium]